MIGATLVFSDMLLVEDSFAQMLNNSREHIIYFKDEKVKTDPKYKCYCTIVQIGLLTVQADICRSK